LAQGQHRTLEEQGRHQSSPQDGQKGCPARPQQATCLREAASAKAGEAKAYSVRYVEPPGAARTKLADFFNILPAGKGVFTALAGMVHLGGGFWMVPILEVPGGVPGC